MLGLLSFATTYTFADDSEVIGNKDSMVANDTSETVNGSYIIHVLKVGEEHGNLVRVVAVKLDYMPVLVAVSTTALKNKDFVQVLKNSGGKSISKDLAKLSVKTDYGKTTTVVFAEIKNQTARDYLAKAGYSAKKHIMSRTVTFTKGNETMTTVQYIIMNDIN